MTSLNFETISASFLDKITDFDIINLEDEVVEELQLGYLKGALGIPYVRALFKTIQIDNDKSTEGGITINYELNVADDNTDEYFVLEVLSKAMVIKWLEPQVKSKVNIAQMFGGKEQRWFSQAQHLSELKDMLETEKISLNKLIRDRGSIFNPYLTR